MELPPIARDVIAINSLADEVKLARQLHAQLILRMKRIPLSLKNLMSFGKNAKRIAANGAPRICTKN